MSRAIFRTSLLVCLLVLIFTAGVFFALRYSQAVDETYAALRQEAFYAEQGLLRGGKAYLAELGSINRVTWIYPNGERPARLCLRVPLNRELSRICVSLSLFDLS